MDRYYDRPKKGLLHILRHVIIWAEEKYDEVVEIMKCL